MKVIFLDIDGVLNTVASSIYTNKHYPDVHFHWLDPMKMMYLNDIIKDVPGVQFVISSTWRKGDPEESKAHILEMFKIAGFEGELHEDWKTTVIWGEIDGRRAIRGDEIHEWLSRHPEVTHYVCIDDDGDFHDDQPLIQTDTYEGLSFRDSQMVTFILDGNFLSKKCRRRELKSIKDYLRKWNQTLNKRNLQKLKTFVKK